jgi:hypothetical protein
LDRDLGEGIPNFLEIVRCEFDSQCADVVLQMLEPAAAWDVIIGKVCISVNLACEETLAQRAVGDKAYPLVYSSIPDRSPV